MINRAVRFLSSENKGKSYSSNRVYSFNRGKGNTKQLVGTSEKVTATA